MAGSWIRFVAALFVVWLAIGCGAGTGRDVADVEAALVEHYIDPLTEAGFTVTVEDTCRYAVLSAAEAWHLDVQLKIDAPPHRVADVLESESMVVRRDREPMIVQQILGNPSGGWNGALAPSGGDDSMLGLVYDNVTHAAWSGAVGWAEPCPIPQG